MLLYHNKCYLRLFFSRKGTIFWRPDILALSLTLVLFATFLQYLKLEGSEYAPSFPNHYGIHAVGTVVSFAVVFRTSLAWNRYWEAVSQLHIMYSKWTDTYAQMIAFANVSMWKASKTPGADAPGGKTERLQEFIHQLTGYFTLMSALAADRLTKGDCERMARRQEAGVSWKDQIVLRRDLRIGEDLTGATEMPVLINAYSSEEIKNAVSATADSFHQGYPVRWVSTPEQVDVLGPSKDRTMMVMYWIIYELGTHSPDLDIAPPIQSRMYQELSNGMLGFSQCLKLADVPFPMPFAQILQCVLSVFAVVTPAYVVAFTDSYLIGAVMTFLAVQGVWGFNELAKELENPFGKDDNDLSLMDFHCRFVDSVNEIEGASQAKHAFKSAKEERMLSSQGGRQPGPWIAPDHAPVVPALTSSQSSPPPVSPPPAAPTPAVAPSIPAPPAATNNPTSGLSGMAEQPPPEMPKERNAGDALSSPSPLVATTALSAPLDRPLFDTSSAGVKQAEQRAVKPAAKERAEEEQLAQMGVKVMPNADARPGDPIAKLVDAQLVQINERMERHLTSIAKDMEALLNAMGNINPAARSVVRC